MFKGEGAVTREASEWVGDIRSEIGSEGLETQQGEGRPVKTEGHCRGT